MVGNSAAYYNMQNDLYRVVKTALGGNDKQLEEILKVLVEIRDVLINNNGENNE